MPCESATTTFAVIAIMTQYKPENVSYTHLKYFLHIIWCLKLAKHDVIDLSHKSTFFKVIAII